MWGSEFFNETLIILLLFFDVREQLLIRCAHITKMSHNDLHLN